MTPHRCLAPYDWPALLALIRAEFAFMDARISPPSPMHSLTADAIDDHARTHEVWAIGDPPHACLFLTPKPHALYLGKLAVAANQRRKGLVSSLITLAETRARALGLRLLEVQTRVELTENHVTFRALGFHESARTCHLGFARPTTLTFQPPVA